MLTIFNKQLIFLTVRTFSLILMLMPKFPFFPPTVLNILNNYILHILITFQIPLFFLKKMYKNKIIKNLDPNKACGHNMISIRMIKVCGISTCKPLEIIFQNYLHSDKFLSKWKKANVVSTFSKGDKQCIKNCCPVSLLLV